MGAASNYLENAILDHVLGNTAYTAPSTVYLALFTAAPSDAGGGTEVSTSSTGYARKAVTNDTTNWPNASSGSKKNGTVIAFDQATGNWGTCTHWGMFDADVDGNLLFWGALTSSQAVLSGDAPRWLINGFEITLD